VAGVSRVEFCSAAQRGDARKVQELLEGGADPNAADDNGWTALMRAAQWDREAVVASLLDRGADPRIKDTDGMTALVWATLHGHPAFAAILKQRGAGAWTGTKTHDNPASGVGIMGRLLDRGAEIDAQDSLGKTALMHAAERGLEHKVALLLRRGADPYVRDESG
jgi:cytohesin